MADVAFAADAALWSAQLSYVTSFLLFQLFKNK